MDRVPEALNEIPESEQDIVKNKQDEVAYLQFTSGSTRAPQGVVVKSMLS